jgi:ClpP class serine protease
MRNRLPFLSQRLFNVPLAIHPRKAEIVVGALAERLGITSLNRLTPNALRPDAMDWFDDDDYSDRDAVSPDMGYDVVAGVAVIPVHGTLVQKLGSVRPYSGMTGYDGIRTAFLCALDDPAAQSVVFDIDSPGGECAGMFDLADAVYAARGEKPIWSILNEMAFSAAYALASATDYITVPRTGGTGSIGVVACHVDFSRALEGAGLTVTFITYGARKAEGAPELPLSKDALEHFQADIDTLGDLFVETVARNRGLPASVVRGTEAATFLGQAGVTLGLADAVMAPHEAFRALRAGLT